MSRSNARAVLRASLWTVLAAVAVALVWLTVIRRNPPRPAPPVIASLPSFVLTNRDGREIGLPELTAGPWVADFIFTRCPGPCPMMTKRMSELGKKLPAGVHRVSFSVDPEFDTPEVLDAYARRFNAANDWLFLTGSREAIWDLSITGFKLGVAPAEGLASEQGPIVHSTRFVLVDAGAGIRGYYEALRPEELDRLVEDAEILLEEQRREREASNR